MSEPLVKYSIGSNGQLTPDDLIYSEKVYLAADVQRWAREIIPLIDDYIKCIQVLIPKLANTTMNDQAFARLTEAQRLLDALKEQP